MAPSFGSTLSVLPKIRYLYYHVKTIHRPLGGRPPARRVEWRPRPHRRGRKGGRVRRCHPHARVAVQASDAGWRPTDLAGEMQMSKQAVNDLLGDLERQGYIRRDVDPADRRSRLIRLTAKGMRLEDTVRLAARNAERQLERELGPDRFRSFREALVEAARILNERA